MSVPKTYIDDIASRRLVRATAKITQLTHMLEQALQVYDEALEHAECPHHNLKGEPVLGGNPLYTCTSCGLKFQ